MAETEGLRKMVLCLNDKQLAMAAEELGETETLRLESFSAVKNWLEENSEKDYVMDDVSLVWFLRACKFDVEKTQTRIDNFFAFRGKVPEWYSDRDPSFAEISELINLGTLLPLPGLDSEGRRVTIIRACLHNPYKHKQDNVFKIMNMLIDLMCRDDESMSVTGVVAIVDLQGVSLGHAMQMTPSMIRKAVSSWQDVSPIRTRGMHFINTPYNAHVILNVFKKFMKQKLRERVSAHGDGRAAMQSLLPADTLPQDYGGKGPSLEVLTEEWSDRVLKNRDWFLNAKQRGPFAA